MDAPADEGRTRRPGDFNQQAELIIDLATGQTTQEQIDVLAPMGKDIGGQASKQAVPIGVRIQSGRKEARKQGAAG